MIILNQNETKEYTISLDIEDMASYDYNDANGNGFKDYELDPGTYTIYVGRNAHDCWKDTDSIKLQYSILEGITYEKDIHGTADGNETFLMI